MQKVYQRNKFLSVTTKDTIEKTKTITDKDARDIKYLF